MASALTYFFNLILLSTFSIIINGENSGWYSATKVMDKMEEKVTNLHFYFHDTVSGDHASAIVIAGPKDTASFGSTRIVDDPLTEGPESTSKLIGKAQGVYSMAAQQDVSLLMVITCAFMEDKYNGSTLSVLGRNPVLQTVREMPIVGGTGLFRSARGYALAHTVWSNTLGDAVVEYNVTVIHSGPALSFQGSNARSATWGLLFSFSGLLFGLLLFNTVVGFL